MSQIRNPQKKQMMTQVMLQTVEPNDDGNYSLRTCWLPHSKKLKVGLTISLKNESDTMWLVKTIYGSRPSSHIHTQWKVGGLE